MDIDIETRYGCLALFLCSTIYYYYEVRNFALNLSLY